MIYLGIRFLTFLKKKGNSKEKNIPFGRVFISICRLWFLHLENTKKKGWYKGTDK